MSQVFSSFVLVTRDMNTWLVQYLPSMFLTNRTYILSLSIMPCTYFQTITYTCDGVGVHYGREEDVRNQVRYIG